jgi:hypothetical protein
MRCNIRSLLPRITLCSTLLCVLPVHAHDSAAACAGVTGAATGPVCNEVRASSGQNVRQRYPLAGLLDQSSESGLGLAFAAVMIGALALRVGLR